jgi:hypothetical protein
MPSAPGPKRALENVVVSSENRTICFTWNITGFGGGNYAIGAYAR